MVDSKKNNFLSNLEVNKHLENIMEAKFFNNGYIFYGAEDVGKKQTALNFIKRIFKQYSTSENIDERITNNNHPDFLMIEPTFLVKGKSTKNKDSNIIKNNNAEIIKIEQIRNIKTFLSQKSIESEKKIVLIIDSHLLNESASNCLLKTLEEPSNGIFILLTSRLNLLLDTIKSRCQIIRFRSFSSKQIKLLLKNHLDLNDLNINKNLDFEDLVHSANGSPGKIMSNIEIWEQLSEEIKSKLDFPLKDSIEILRISKLISEELENYQQICLINLIQQMWWRKTKNISLIEKLERLKIHIKSNIQTRISWEVTLLKIAMEEF